MSVMYDIIVESRW